MELAIAAGGGVALTTAIVKAIILKTLKDFGDALKQIGEIKTELASITVKLQTLAKDNQIIRELERKIIALETRINSGRHSHRR